jgi:hypothetical protein
MFASDVTNFIPQLNGPLDVLMGLLVPRTAEDINQVKYLGIDSLTFDSETGRSSLLVSWN